MMWNNKESQISDYHDGRYHIENSTRMNNLLGRIVLIEVDGVKRIKNAVRALRSKRLVSKVGRPQYVIGDKELIVQDEIIIESRSGSYDEDAPYIKVSMGTACLFVKRHPEPKRSSPKNVDVNHLTVSCQSVQQPWISQRTTKMANSTLVATVVADGFALPSVILWPSKSLPDEMKPLLSQTLDIWPNGSDWMGGNQFKKCAHTTLLQGIIDRRKRMSLENSHCLLLIDSHTSRADPTIWREFQKEKIYVVTLIPHGTHISQPFE
ncbi:uncharacterized protein MONOS_11074 [Monocercomonoides exilis]|uniref:uncharacterized protein n=1 Tax=Monocercomonoides exilis TaxID=2049356 RepID=UPI00355A6BC9|nr:hypothetical protein MONOS_11074 [Monocercomonoides exilis]|eukprot:MONOS_11074.1-p1 / transcript=MONOS_11074.1 / gene=MONOS_11074 / organism=Monocercomonoides_exilis_PA203 / gene_product=unspecified product / transcript_product=unspecified product / location=Mono_scaffold00535:5594-6662(+) / protein_length=264 / sequence_SO=supercontig / SO=protein_coding / is_pseudo=false